MNCYVGPSQPLFDLATYLDLNRQPAPIDYQLPIPGYRDH
jgi:hypothetical protein